MTGIAAGIFVWFILRFVITGLYIVDQNERAVVTTFGKAPRTGKPQSQRITDLLSEEEKERYNYPAVDVIRPGLHFRFPWQKVHKVSIATQTAEIAYDPEDHNANHKGMLLEAVTKDQLNTGLKGQIRLAVSEENLYAYLFGVNNPVAHVMGFFVSILRERIASFEAPASAQDDRLQLPGISINDLRKNLNEINRHMENECRPSVSRYGITLDAALITEINPPGEVDSALAAINTAHNQVSSEISLAQAAADQKIVQSKKAVEIETLKAQAEVQLLQKLAQQLSVMKKNGPDTLKLYLRNIRLKLYSRAKKIILEAAE